MAALCAFGGAVPSSQAGPKTAPAEISDMPSGAKTRPSAVAKGLWPMPNKDPQNTGRADLPGNMTSAPRDVWQFGHRQHEPRWATTVAIGEDRCFLLDENGRLQMVRPDGVDLWHIPFGGACGVVGILDGQAGKRVLACIGEDTLVLLEARTGKEMWRWSAPSGCRVAHRLKLVDEGGPPSSPHSFRLFVFPTGTVDGDWGYCFQFDPASPQPAIVWKKQYPGLFMPNFGPLVVLADMDKDGRNELVLAGKPAVVAVIDADSGETKFHLKYPIQGDSTAQAGRPYGLLCADDLDGDGYPDVVVVSCAVEDYVTVLHNVAGKSLELSWSRYIETDFPENRHGIAVWTTSVSDVDGNGKKELVIGLFDADQDARWHTCVYATVAGKRTPLLDLPDRYFWGCYDINADGRDELIVAERRGRDGNLPGRIEAIDGSSGKVLAFVEDARIVAHSQGGAAAAMVQAKAHGDRHVPPVTAMNAAGQLGLVVERSAPAGQCIWSIGKDGSVFAPFAPSRLSRALLASQGSPSPVALDLGLPGRNTSGPAAGEPLVACCQGRRELILALSNDTVTGGRPDLSTPGVLRDAWVVRGGRAAVWQASDGRRTVTTAEADGRTILAWANPTATPEPIRIELPAPMTKGYWQIPFDLDGRMGLLVPMQRQVHAQACAVFDDAGRQVWADLHHGPYPQQAAVGDLDGDGKVRFVIDDHGWQAIYDPNGASHLLAQAWHDTIRGRGDGSAYVTPIVGPFGPDGQTRIVMSPGLMALEVLDPAGRRLVKRDFKPDVYAFATSGAAVARLRRNGWDLGIIEKSGRFHCVDLATAQTRWTMDLGCPTFVAAQIVSGDVNGDGDDEFVVGLPDGSLYALGEADGAGRTIWKTALDYGIRKLIQADVDGDGKAELIVGTEDGVVHILR